MEITPPHLRCGMGSCPSVHVLEDGGLEVRGELVVIHETLAKAAGHEVKTAEATVVIPAEYFSALPELVRLREENEKLTKLLEGRDAFIVGKGMWFDFVDTLPLGCQADDTEKGTVSSPSALQKSAGEDAEEWAECGFGICEDCGAGLIDDFQCLRCKWQERRRMGLKVWRPCECHLHEHQVCDLCQGVPKRIQRPDEERASAKSAHSKEAGGLTPHSKPQESTQDG